MPHPLCFAASTFPTAWIRPFPSPTLLLFLPTHTELTSLCPYSRSMMGRHQPTRRVPIHTAGFR